MNAPEKKFWIVFTVDMKPSGKTTPARMYASRTATPGIKILLLIRDNGFVFFSIAILPTFKEYFFVRTAVRRTAEPIKQEALPDKSWNMQGKRCFLTKGNTEALRKPLQKLV